MTRFRMKVKESLSNLIAEFAGMSKTPDFKPKLNESPSLPKLVQENVRSDRRHSLNITVGALEVPNARRVRSDSLTANEKTKAKYDAKLRRQSAPAISSAESKALKKKLADLRGKTHSDEEIREEEEE